MRGAVVALAAVALLLGGCSSRLTEDNLDLGLVVERTAAVLRRTPVSEPFTATRASLAAGGLRGPLLILTNEGTGARAGFLPEATNRGAITWRSADDRTVRTRGGVLAATRGLNFDLVAAEDAPFRRALAAGGGNYVRAIRDLTADGTLRRIELDCALRRGGSGTVVVLGRGYAVTRWTERCSGSEGPVYPEAPGGLIENVYEIDEDAAIRRSRQWAAPHLGYLVLELTEI